MTRLSFFFSLLLLLPAWTLAQDSANLLSNNGMPTPAKIVVGDDPSQFPIGWTDGVCYHPIVDVIPGDQLEFTFAGHDVQIMASKDHWDTCNFTSATMVAGVGASPFTYTVTQEDIASNNGDGRLYFACGVGAHCQSGNQKVQVAVSEGIGSARTAAPVSRFALGASAEQCEQLQQANTTTSTTTTTNNLAQNGLQSECSDPVLNTTDNRYYVSCLSGPATMTPGGVINNLFMLHYPYPKDQRVAVGLRTWEFVQDVVGAELNDDGTPQVIPVPINQLYVHHLSGRVILGQGTEGVRRSEPDAPFVEPYAQLTGDEGDLMIFHIIDLRNVTDWLPCIECRCKDDQGTYLDVGGSGDGVSTTGGVDCCHNCTALTSPTVDYRMRYNVSYSYIAPEQPVAELLMLTADISPAVGKNLEFDVPAYTSLPQGDIKPEDPFVQRLTRTMPFHLMFHHEFFGPLYHGPETVQLFRCVGHLHVAAIGMWLEDAETGEMLCDGLGFYGTDPNADKGFLNAVAVDDYQEPKVFPYDRLVTLVTEYNATELHTGVMGMEFIFVSGDRMVTSEDVQLTVNTCISNYCQPALLPRVELPDAMMVQEDVCEDTLIDHPSCMFGNMCDCEEFVTAPESTGCGGVYASEWGDVDVHSVCRKYCGCPPVTGGSCEDALQSSPVCSFGNLCDCEVFVNAAESTGCGGVYTSNMGDIAVNDMCANYCDACPDITPEEKMAEDFTEALDDMLQDACKYSTQDCRRALNNLHGCADQQVGAEDLHPVIQRVLQEEGHSMAMKHAKLGDSSIHRGQSPPDAVPQCPADEGVSQLTCNAQGADDDAGLCADYTSQNSVVCECYYFCGTTMLGCLTNEESAMYSCDQGAITTCHGANVELPASSAGRLAPFVSMVVMTVGAMACSLFVGVVVV